MQQNNYQRKDGGNGGEIQFQGQKPRFFNKKKDTSPIDDALGFQKGAAIGQKQNGQPNDGAVQYVEKKQNQQDAGFQRVNGENGAQQNPVAQAEAKPTLNADAKPFVMVQPQQPAVNLGGQQLIGQPGVVQQNPGEEEDLAETFIQTEMQNQPNIPFQEPTDGEFANFPEIHKKTVANLQAKGYQALFPIQYKCFYPVYNREDLIARDLTGSGKTFAFGLPLVEYLRRQKILGSRKLAAIILAPTRELAIQVTNELLKLKHHENEFRLVTVYGGVNIDEQIRQLRGGVDIFVGTTGRVLDHIERGNIDFSNVKTVVLDEADQMLKLGFKEDVDRILRNVRDVVSAENLQLCLFSATIPSWVKSIARQFMKKAFRVVDLAQDLKNKTAAHVNHLAIECPFQNRMSALADILICYGGNAKTIVFTQTKQDANSLILSDKISQDIEVMHGDIAQNQREVTMKRFKEGKFQVLVATDVASRGLDIQDVDLVLQIEPPKDTETYIHRSGRTARAGKSGTCITFYTKKTYEFIQRIEDQAGIKLKRIGVPQPEDVIRASSRGILKNLLDVNEDVLHLFEDLAKVLIDQHDGNAERALQIALAYCSGHYKHKLVSKSLLNGQENQTTIRMSVQRGRLGANNCYAILKKYWDPRVCENIRNMKSFRDQSGVVFDIRAENFEAFMDNYTRLKETGDRIDFDCAKCADLPDLEDDFGYGNNQNWRDTGYGGGRGGGGGGGYQSRGGGGGGYQRGGHQQQSNQYHDQNNGGWGNKGGAGRGGYGGGAQTGGWGNRQDSYRNNNFEQQDDFSGNNWSKGRGGFGGQSGGNQGAPGFSNYGGSDFRPKTAGPPRGDAPIIGSNNAKPKQNAPGCCCYVSNLRFQVKEHELMEFFKEAKFDPIRARLLYDNEGNSKGTGFVEMGSQDNAADAATALNNEYFQGRKLNVNVANQN